LEIAESGKFDTLSVLERSPYFFKEGLNHVLGFAFVKADFLEQKICQVSFGQRHGFLLLPELGSVFFFKDRA
jgi:hypothetical protein